MTSHHHDIASLDKGLLEPPVADRHCFLYSTVQGTQTQTQQHVRLQRHHSHLAAHTTTENVVCGSTIARCCLCCRPQLYFLTAKADGCSDFRLQHCSTARDKKNKGIGSRETRDCFPWVLSRIVIGYVYIWRLWLAVLVVQKLLTPIFISLLAMESVSLDCSVEQTDHSVEQRLSLAYRGDLS
jgi:hypothetical protein